MAARSAAQIRLLRAAGDIADAPSVRLYLLLFVTGFVSVGLEIVLTRLFSVAYYHHFAFLAISLALLGLGMSGLCLALLGDRLRQGMLGWLVAGLALATAATPLGVVLSPWQIPQHLSALAGMTLWLGLFAIPFLFAGLILGIALRDHARYAGRVYAADLAGAAAGCGGAMGLLHGLGGPAAVWALAGLAALSGTLLDGKVARRLLLATALGIMVLAGWQARTGIIQIHAPGTSTQIPLLERWNGFSRVAVIEPVSAGGLASTLNPAYTGNLPDYRYCLIDSAAVSHILAGPPENATSYRFLDVDLSYAAYAVGNKPGRSLLIGSGGGRDVWAALRSGQREIVAVEVNSLLPELVEGEMAAFSGRPYAQPGVSLVIDDARGFLARDIRRWDYINAPFACTWAAHAGAGLALSEYSLYTREAFDLFLDRLTPNGILSFTLWFRGTPGETLRLLRLAGERLRVHGAVDPTKHLAVLLLDRTPQAKKGAHQGFATVLVKNSPFSVLERGRLRDFAVRSGTQLAFAPAQRDDSLFARALDPQSTIGTLDLRPPEDDRPFFFYLLRTADALPLLLGDSGSLQVAVHRVLWLVFAASLVLTLGLLVLPAILAPQRHVARAPRLWLMAYFALIGIGFMWFEIPLLQRFGLILGNPTLALSLTLGGLLVSLAAGSLWVQYRRVQSEPREILVRLLVALVLAGAIQIGWESLHEVLLRTPLAARVAALLALLLPLGVCLGGAFPLALRMAAREAPDWPAWAWALNGTGSVLGSVLAVMLAIEFGFGAVWWLGVCAYTLALLMLWGHVRRRNQTGPSGVT